MAEGFHLQIITPDENFYEGEASMVELTTTEGEIGIYKGHIPLTAIISPGILRIHTEGEVREAALMSGFIQVMPEEIDVKRAEEARVRAERRLKSHSAEVDVTRAELALKRAMVRLEVRK